MFHGIQDLVVIRSWLATRLISGRRTACNGLITGFMASSRDSLVSAEPLSMCLDYLPLGVEIENSKYGNLCHVFYLSQYAPPVVVS